MISFLFTKAQTTEGTKRCICNTPWDEKDTNQQRQKWEHWRLELARCYFECGTSGATKWQKGERKKHFSKVAKVNIIQFIPLKGKLRVVNAILHVSDLGSLVYHLKFYARLKNMHIIKVSYSKWQVLVLWVGVFLWVEKKCSVEEVAILFSVLPTVSIESIQKLLSWSHRGSFSRRIPAQLQSWARIFSTATFWVGQYRVLRFDGSEGNATYCWNRIHYHLSKTQIGACLGFIEKWRTQRGPNCKGHIQTASQNPNINSSKFKPDGSSVVLTATNHMKYFSKTN